MKKLLLAITFLSAAALYADVPLMKNGKPVCTIIPAPGENPTLRYAAEELSHYLGRIGGGTAPAIAAKAEKGKSAVIFRLDKNPKIGKHGFQLETKGNTLYIRAQKPLGLLYGAYEILKKYGGIRWIHPGPKGEFFKVKSAIAVPDVNKISNPSFTTRTFHFGVANWTGPFEPTWDWMVRNNMHVEWDAGSVLERVRPKMYGHAVKLGATWRCGWHCFTRLHMGYYTAKDKKQCLADYRKMFQEHPERFALIRGKRQDYDTTKEVAFQCQPCTTNKDNIRIIAHNLVETIRMIRTNTKVDPAGRFFMSNNDTTAWCECPECKAAADPEETEHGCISTRYWKFINAVTAEARKEMPDIPITASAYQNFHPAPIGVKPDPHVSVLTGFNDTCFRHNLDDPACPINRIYHQYYKDWGKVNPNPSTWEEVGDIGMHYQALEFIYANHLKVYHKIGIQGTCPSVCPMLAGYGKHLGEHKYRYENNWAVMWQQHYLAALLQWDINTDVEKTWEEANALYYGAAWNNGMRDYRKLLIKISETTEGCHGYQIATPVSAGRCLETIPGAEARLLAYLDQAEKAAKDDPRVLAAIQIDRNFLNELWIKRNREFRKVPSHKLSAHKTTGKIVIDGKLSESDWSKTAVMSHYRNRGGKDVKHQTFIRFLYEPDYLYVAIEAMDPAVDKLDSTSTKHDDDVWRDNSVELMLNHPAMIKKYCHFIINDKGVFRDSFVDGMNTSVRYESRAEIAVGKNADRWIVEMKIPAAAVKSKIVPGQSWRFNSQRYRIVTGEKNEGSSLVTGGNVHDVSLFVTLNFEKEAK